MYINTCKYSLARLTLVNCDSRCGRKSHEAPETSSLAFLCEHLNFKIPVLHVSLQLTLCYCSSADKEQHTLVKVSHTPSPWQPLTV